MPGESTKDKRTGFWKFLQFTAGKVFARRFRYSCEQIEAEGPVLIVSNHVTNHDPFFLGLAHKRAPLSFVASEHIFRLGFISKVIDKLLSPIPRSKGASGATTVKNCLRRLRAGESVALFAEGDCTWDGRSKPVFPATGKLAKAAGVPLVTFRIEGGYLSSPRWSKKARKGRMHGAPVHVYGVDELKAMTAEEVTRAIDRDIFEDAWARQDSEHVPYASKARAVGLERALFICPECGGTCCMKTHRHSLKCALCGTERELDEYGFFRDGRFRTVAEWDEWQKTAITGIRGRGLFRGEGSLTRIGGAKKKVDYSLELPGGRGEIRLGEMRLPFSEISDMAMVKTNRLLFTTGEGYYELMDNKGELRPFLIAWEAFRGTETGK
ncbi:MAG: 1-acyl-sn-glycerol-3-phosphate acyltransferase [Clostridia bacterium]|nr:1-acyl-sn-glycerol-3-phosphate acyltransferase [Clostridia bacterium]